MNNIKYLLEIIIILDKLTFINPRDIIIKASEVLLSTKTRELLDQSVYFFL